MTAETKLSPPQLVGLIAQSIVDWGDRERGDITNWQAREIAEVIVEALNGQGYFIAYQPEVDALNNKLEGIELALKATYRKLGYTVE